VRCFVRRLPVVWAIYTNSIAFEHLDLLHIQILNLRNVEAVPDDLLRLLLDRSISGTTSEPMRIKEQISYPGLKEHRLFQFESILAAFRMQSRRHFCQALRHHLTRAYNLALHPSLCHHNPQSTVTMFKKLFGEVNWHLLQLHTNCTRSSGTPWLPAFPKIGLAMLG
jgi:hypothetical protein